MSLAWKKTLKRAHRYIRRNMRRARGSHKRWMRTVEHGWTYSTRYIEMAYPEALSPRSWRRRLIEAEQHKGDVGRSDNEGKGNG